MKYFTKEWYEIAQKTDMHLLLKVSKNAEVFSEDYFKKLFKSEECSWLKLQQDVANVKFEDVYPEEFIAEHVDGSLIDPEEYEELKIKYFERRELAAVAYADRPPFDAALEKKKFKQALNFNIKSLKSKLPEKILSHVADIRVLALDRASASVKKEITEFCKENQKLVNNAAKNYKQYYHKAFKNGEPYFAETFHFHDCKVVSCRKSGKSLIIQIDNSHGFTSINQIVFENCTILEREVSLAGAWWLYDEIYKTNAGYEIHILLQNSQSKLLSFIVLTTDVKLKQ